MNATPAPPEHDLQAYVDGWLAAARRGAIERYLAEHREDAARIQAYRTHSAAVRAAMGGTEYAAIPERLRSAARSGAVPGRAVWQVRAVAAALLLAVGLGGGWALRVALVEPVAPRVAAGMSGASDLPRLAAAAHRVYSVEERYPVEVRAEETRLMGWLSKRVGRPLNAPDLDGFGFRLMGGRVLPAAIGAAAQLMYEDGNGRRISVYVQGSPRGAETPFRFADESGLGAFYWLDDEMGYALVGPLQRTELLDLAKSVYQQIEM
jgi:anti-sigma factor RsiW